MQERAEATRRYLVEAAARLFEERGYAGTSISDISAQSGRTSGAIYFHFSNKEKLALAVVTATLDTWPAMIAEVRASPAPALDKLVSLSFAVARAFRDDVVVRAGSRLWMERRAIEAPVPGPFAAWTETVTGLLREARESGELAPGIAPDTAALTVVYAFFGLHTVSEAVDGRARIEERLQGMWEVLLPALQAEPAPAALLARVRAAEPAGPGGSAEFAGAAGPPSPEPVPEPV
ncbi:ScbR family autoregulator-binding transcription factor [Streptomyces sp. NPDC020983]|uniref:ScbR family autoregulator-binding transcription factor n=1 Tax=Streptomyces sp. NPDC020983 TaxID=3365106 RepID=UPI003795CF9E